MGDVLDLARWQFAVTTIYHFFFVPLTIGLSFFIAIMELLHYKTKNEKYKQMIKFWGRLFLINFAMGVVTGLVQEFQFGMNWSNYSRFVGDVFGVPLAIEALLAFFLESTFLGIWIFGEGKVPEKIHLLSIWIVAAATAISAFWILTANSFMHEPTGYVLKNGRAEMVDFGALITNKHLWVQFPHTIFAAFSTAAFFILGISAYHMLKKNSEQWVKSSFKMGVIAALIFTVLTAGMGDLQGKYLVNHLPMKMAAAEALWDSKDPASFSIIALINEKEKKNIFEISIPRMLSFMSYSSFSGKVEGLKDIQEQYEKKYGPGNYIPPVNLSFYSFRLMIGAGMLMIFLSLLALYFYKKNKLDKARLLLKLLVPAVVLPYIANSTGWILTEVSRTPWIVFGLMRLDEAVSPTVSAGYVLISLLIFTLVYSILIVIDVSLIIRFAKQPIILNAPGSAGEVDVKEESSWI